MRYRVTLLIITLVSHCFGADNRGIGSTPVNLQERIHFSNEARQIIDEENAPPQTVSRLTEGVFSSENKVTVAAIFCGQGVWKLRLTFPNSVIFTQSIEENSIFLTFNQRVDSPDLLKAQEALGYLIKRFANGFNSIYLESHRPIIYQTHVCDRQFEVDLIPDLRQGISASKSLKLSRARFLIEERCYRAAFWALRAILDEYPRDKEALVLLATLEGVLPRWQKAFHILEGLRADNPYDNDIQALLHDVFFPHSSFLRFERQLQRTKNFAAQQIYRLQNEWIIGNSGSHYSYAGGFVQAERGHISQVVNQIGDTVGFLGTRFQGGLYGRMEYDNGLFSIGRLWMGQGVVFGGGGEVGTYLPQLQGYFSLLADVNKPYWEIFETLAHFGRETRFKFALNSVYSRHIYWNFDGGIHRVGIRKVSNGLTSLLANGDIFLNLRVINPIVAFNYGLNAEWVIEQDRKTGPTGNRFTPVPLDSYEYHSLRAYIFYELQNWFFTGFFGGTFNRLGTNDITAGITLKYVKPCPCGWEVELSAIRFPSTTVQGARSEYLTAVITLRF